MLRRSNKKAFSPKKSYYTVIVEVEKIKKAIVYHMGFIGCYSTYSVIVEFKKLLGVIIL